MSGTEERIKERVETAVLFDFYSELLKDQTRDIIEDYILNDYSLAEIAERLNITRQGVRDFVKRGETQLRDYEAKLHLAEKYKNREKTTELISSGLNQLKKDASEIQLKQINELLQLLNRVE